VIRIRAMKLMETAMQGEWAKFPRVHFTHVLGDASPQSWSYQTIGSDSVNVIRISGAYPLTITNPNNENGIFEEHDLKPAPLGENNLRSWTIDSVRYYCIEKSNNKPTKLHIKCDKNNGFSIDLLKPGSNNYVTKIPPHNATEEPAGETTWRVNLPNYGSVPYVIRMRMEHVVNPTATLTFIKE
jgi:hypothetical protein